MNPKQGSAPRGEGSWRIGVDIGGTFTDFVILTPQAQLERIKLLSTPEDYSKAITAGLQEKMSEQARRAVSTLVHGTTVATNALLEERPQHIALITTEGFRDVLELRRARRPHLYELNWRPPAPLVARELRLEVRERMDAAGKVVTPLDDGDVERCIETIRQHGVEAVAVCLINSFANPAHERAIAERVARALPKVKVTYSAMLAPEPKEFERTSTTAVNAFLLPVIHDYLSRLEGSLQGIGVRPTPQVMQSDGTIASATIVRDRPFLIIESGPAAGVVASARLAEELGMPRVITFDMGGTTAKASLIEDYRVVLTEELEVGESINRGGGYVRGSGHVVRSPCVDLSEVGSGGGSIAWVDGGGSLRVGPRSTGANPGPACYGLGGTEATVTDAHVVLGYVNPTAIAGGRKQIHSRLAHEAIGRLADRLKVSVQDAAYGVYTVATATMRRAVRAVSVERGRDPRAFTLYAFGGAGGLHAAALAAELEMSEVVVPIAPGLFSSLGLLFSDVAVTRVASVRLPLSAATLEALRGQLDKLAREASEELQRHHGTETHPQIEALAGMQYVGQSSILSIPLPKEAGAAQERSLAAAFHREHARVYGHCAESEPVELASVRVRAVAAAPRIRFDQLAESYIGGEEPGDRERHARDMYFGPSAGTQRTPVLARRQLQRTLSPGPVLIEEPESTIVVPPGFSAMLHQSGSVLIKRDREEGQT